MPDMNENAETQQEYFGKVKPISAEGLQNENTTTYKMGEIMEMDADFVTLLNFVDWYSPTKEVNEKLTKMLRHIGSQTYQNQTKIEEAKEIILNLYNAGRDTLMCLETDREEVIKRLEKAINDKRIKTFLKG